MGINMNMSKELVNAKAKQSEENVARKQRYLEQLTNYENLLQQNGGIPIDHPLPEVIAEDAKYQAFVHANTRKSSYFCDMIEDLIDEIDEEEKLQYKESCRNGNGSEDDTDDTENSEDSSYLEINKKLKGYFPKMEFKDNNFINKNTWAKAK